MRAAEQGFLLLTSSLGNPDRKPLTLPQLRILRSRASAMAVDNPNRELSLSDLTAMGYGQEMARRILALLNEKELLARYLQAGMKKGCIPLAAISEGFPQRLHSTLGGDCPGCLWAMGELEILNMPKISLVGSRDIRLKNRKFAYEVGAQAARQGFALVSGNARGADSIAQQACLEHGGFVISFVADELINKPACDNALFLSEDGFDLPFSSQRALSRNRLIHSLGQMCFVAQSTQNCGGTWNGAVKNLRFGWSPVYCFADGSNASRELQDMGAICVELSDLCDLLALEQREMNLFDAL